VAVVTTVAPAHLEAFGVIEGIAHEKASIYEGLSHGGIALAHTDIDTAEILYKKAQAVGANLTTFGASDTADIRLTELHTSDTGSAARALIQGEPMVFRLAVPGRHNAMNALITLATCDALGADVAEAAMALATWVPVSGRGTRETLDLGGRGRSGDRPHRRRLQRQPRLADRRARRAGVHRPARGRAARGDTGRHAGAGRRCRDHPRRVANDPAMAKIDIVHTAGPLMEHLHNALPASRRGRHADTSEALAHSVPQSCAKATSFL
jgi:UDP-N-acetylmuramoyl-tripeptide--D-alanyl-D-alanine ligase